jgi:hypothetical protein
MDKLERLEELFADRHFDREVILQCVRWNLRFKLSLRDLVKMMAERGLSLSHTTIMRRGSALHTGVRKALAQTCPYRRPVPACRRDIRQNPRCVALSISCRGPVGSDSRLQTGRQA